VSTTALIVKNEIDATGIATLCLAATTVWLGWTTRRAAKAAEVQTRNSAEEIRQAQRPVLVPSGAVEGSSRHPAVTLLNAGSGPALNILASVGPASEDRGGPAFGPVVVAAGSRDSYDAPAPIGSGWWAEALTPLRLAVQYEDVGGTVYLTTAAYVAGEAGWINVHVDLLDHRVIDTVDDSEATWRAKLMDQTSPPSS
jgi:hypothetical protein